MADLERRIVTLERANRALKRDLQAARGIGVGEVKVRAKINAGGQQIEHVAQPGKDADVATQRDLDDVSGDVTGSTGSNSEVFAWYYA
jgi:hypothetical protein